MAVTRPSAGSTIQGTKPYLPDPDGRRVPEVSVVIPATNEEEGIGEVLREVRRALLDYDLEIVVVDTDSRDRTVEIARAAGARVVSEPRRGYGRAYKTGFAEARGTIVATLDADLTYPASALPAMIEMVKKGEADFVTGDRMSGLKKGAMTGMHRIGNAILNASFRLLFRHRIVDSQSGMWVFRRDLLSSLKPVSDRMAFSEEIKAEVVLNGYRFREVPILYRERRGEKKIRSVRDAFDNFLFLFRKRFGWLRET